MKSDKGLHPALLVADAKQNIFDLPGFTACSQSGAGVSVLTEGDLIPLPQGSNLFFLPERIPIAYNRQQRLFMEIPGYRPVAAFMSPGYTALGTVAYTEEKGAGLLPLFSYVPVAWYKGAYYVPALRVDRRKNHDLTQINRKVLERRIGGLKGMKNRLLRHLADCALKNSCPNAVNLFLGRYECPLPTSPACNASCLGCISFQPAGSCPATQPRLKFVPTPAEVAEVALMHIAQVRQAVVSFGQGCEGEPLLSSDVIAEAVTMIRRKTGKGTIHMNSNASLTKEVVRLCRIGLDSIRVSLNSAQPALYQRYYGPRGYGFDDVCASMMAARKQGKFVALNYLVMPGLTDRSDEFAALTKLVRKTKINMIQWRNLNYDPLRYFTTMDIKANKPLLGIRQVMGRLKEKFPNLKYGYFNRPKEMFKE